MRLMNRMVFRLHALAGIWRFIAAGARQFATSGARWFAALGLVAIWAGLLCFGATAFAVTEETEAAITEAQRRIEESATDYEAAVARMGELEEQAAENEGRIAALEEELPRQQERSDEAVRALYKMGREGYSLVDMVLSSESIGDFLARIDFLARLQDRNVEAVRTLTAMEQELDETKAALEEAIAETGHQEEEAATALAVAKEARAEAQARAQEEARLEREAIEAAKRAAEEEAARKAAEAAAEEAAAAEQAASKEAPEDEEAAEADGPPTVAPSDDNADWGDDKAAFVAQWAGRIDGYLAGSPLAGTGELFAAAAWDYGVDPRWSPAISTVESSKGAACFKPHNAWGWGSASWGSWEEAINAHVAGLARGYGYTLSESAAKKYCPPNWRHWYDRCAAEMNSI